MTKIGGLESCIKKISYHPKHPNFWGWNGYTVEYRGGGNSGQKSENSTYYPKNKLIKI